MCSTIFEEQIDQAHMSDRKLVITASRPTSEDKVLTSPLESVSAVGPPVDVAPGDGAEEVSAQIGLVLSGSPSKHNASSFRGRTRALCIRSTIAQDSSAFSLSRAPRPSSTKVSKLCSSTRV